MDTHKAAQHAVDHVDKVNQFGNGKCAAKVREAVEAGLGRSLTREELPPLREWINPKNGKREKTRWARDYGPTFEKAGWSDKKEVAAGVGSRPSHYTPKVGDIVVIQPTSDPKHPEGHAAIYTREGWVSDYKQGSDFYPNARYRSEKPSYVIYRKPG